MFLGGYMSDMTGSKALHLKQHCIARGQAFIRFDYTGHGQSDRAFVDGCIGDWARDALAVLDQLTEGPQILVGSSMGGWMMLWLARARPERVKALVGIAAAPDFTEDLMWATFTDAEKATITETGVLERANDYSDEPYRITKKLIEDGRENLVLTADIPFAGSARFLHGTADLDVPVECSIRAMDKLISTDVRVELIKGGDHRLSTEENLAHLSRVLDEVSS
jgi:pimeloyl-ACP methyl ester carboxylesterase